MERKKVAVIGAGGIANSVHLPSLSEIPDCEIAAVCDLREEKAAAAAQKYGIPHTYTLMSEMFAKEKLDGVFCLVEPDRMFRVVTECLDAGLPVFMEKPAGINSYQAESIARKSKKTGLPVAVGMNRRFIPLVRYVAERMKELTPITQVDGVFIKNSDVADCWNYASSFVCDIVHAVDLVRHLAGSEPCKAATIISAHNSPVDNAWSSVMQFENGVTGTLKANYQTGGRVHTFEIHGPGASAFINLGFGDAACDAKILHFGGKSIYSISAAGVGQQQIDVIDGREIAGGDAYHQYYGYKQEDLSFIQALKSGNAPACAIDDAAKSMRMVEFLLENRI